MNTETRTVLGWLAREPGLRSAAQNLGMPVETAAEFVRTSAGQAKDDALRDVSFENVDWIGVVIEARKWPKI